MENILNLKNVLVKTEKFKKVIINVMIVQKCNFNDTFYIAEKEILISELKDSPIIYFDPFLGKSKDCNINIAIALIDENNYYVIKDNNEFKEVIEKNVSNELINTTKYDDRTFLASHIRIS